MYVAERFEYVIKLLYLNPCLGKKKKMPNRLEVNRAIGVLWQTSQLKCSVCLNFKK